MTVTNIIFPFDCGITIKTFEHFRYGNHRQMTFEFIVCCHYPGHLERSYKHQLNYINYISRQTNKDRFDFDSYFRFTFPPMSIATLLVEACLSIMQ